MNSLDLDSLGNGQESLTLPEQICTFRVLLKSLGSLVGFDAFLGERLSSSGQLLVVGLAPSDQILLRISFVQLPKGSLTGLRTEGNLSGECGGHCGSSLSSLESGLERLDSREEVPTLCEAV